PEWRDTGVDQPIGESGAMLRLAFAVPGNVSDELKHLQDSINAAHTIAMARTALPDSYRTAFLVLLGASGLAAVGFGIWAASFVTRRINALVSTARKVSEGQLDARVELRGHDELAELGSAFNTMLDDLDQTRAQL